MSDHSNSANANLEKYKQFRNFMTNELGITRGDIETWTRESAAMEASKRLDQMNIDQMVAEQIAKKVRESLFDYSNQPKALLIDAIRKVVTDGLLARLNVTMKPF